MSLSDQQIGMNTASMAGWSLESALSHGRGIGLGAIEILGFEGARHSQGDLAGFEFDTADEGARTALADACAPYTKKAVHAPFIDLPLVTTNNRLAAFAEAQMIESIRLCAHLGGNVVVVHPNAKRNFDVSEYRDDLLAAFRRLGDAAAPLGVSIAVENMPDVVPETADRFCALIFEIDHSAVGACLDTGHVLGMVSPEKRCTAAGAQILSETAASVARTLGDKLRHVHIHDVRGVDWRDHREVGTGVIDYVPLFSALADIGYGGALSLEMEEPDKIGAVSRSVERIRTLIKNANEREP